MKICSKCLKIANDDEIAKNKSYCKNCAKQYSKQYYDNNREKCLEKLKTKRQNNKELYQEKDRQYYYNNKEFCLKKSKKWKDNNKDKIREYRNQYNKERYQKLKNDPIFKLRKNIRNSINKFLKKNLNRKSGSILKYLPYTIQELRNYLESKFENWMNWENYGSYECGRKKWHLDHIRPHSSFFYTSMEELDFKKCWALENLRPLEATENMSKQDKFETLDISEAIKFANDCATIVVQKSGVSVI